MRKLRSDYEFADPAFADVPLEEPLSDPALRTSLAALLQRRLIPLAGAGLSAGQPSAVPAGTAVADRLAAFARRSGLRDEIDALADPTDLGLVSAVIKEHLGRPTLERELLEIEWAARPFNLGHLAIALMYGEGLIRTGFTTNWDPLVTRASETIAGLQLSCPCDLDSLRAAGQTVLVHLHGDAAHPPSLVATSEELLEPDAALWTQPQLAAALARGELVLIGFSVEPEYIVTTLEAVIGVVGSVPAGVINRQPVSDFVAQSPRLAAAAGVDAKCTHYVEGSASDSLGELLRATYYALLSEVLDDAEQRARAVFGPWVSDSGVELVRSSSLRGSVADLLGLLWIAAYLPSGNRGTRQPTLNAVRDYISASLAVLFALASAADVTDLASTSSGMRLQTLDGPADVWVVVPEARMTTTTAARASAEHSHRLTRLTDLGVPLIMVLAHTDGPVPSGGHPSLLGSAKAGMLTSGRLPNALVTLDSISTRAAHLSITPPSPLKTLVRLA